MIVTDNGTNMVKAVKVMQMQIQNGTSEFDEARAEIGRGFNQGLDGDDVVTAETNEVNPDPLATVTRNFKYRRLPCFTHTIELTLKVLDKIQTYSKTMTRARAMVQQV